MLLGVRRKTQSEKVLSFDKEDEEHVGIDSEIK